MVEQDREVKKCEGVTTYVNGNSTLSNIFMPRPPAFRPQNIPCPVRGCKPLFVNNAGVEYHLRTGHNVNPYALGVQREHTTHHSEHDSEPNRQSDPGDGFEPFDDPLNDEPINDHTNRNSNNARKEVVIKHELINGKHASPQIAFFQ